jgi:hypothetical protein
MADSSDREITLERIAVYFDERMLDHDTGAGFFELAPSPLLEARVHTARAYGAPQRARRPCATR